MPAAVKFSKDQVVIAIESFFTQVPSGEVFVKKGERLRGDAEAVKKLPQFFSIDGASDLEIHQQREEVVFGPQNAAADAADRVQREERSKREPAPIPLERRLRVARGFRQGFGRSFAEGQIVDREDKAVARAMKEHPEFFEIPGRPLAQ